MIYAILLGSLVVLGFAFNAGKRLYRFKTTNDKDILSELFDPYDSFKFPMIVGVSILLMILVIVFLAFNSFFFATLAIELVELINLLILFALADAFGKKYLRMLSGLMVFIDIVMIIYIFLERIPGLSKYFALYATAAYIILVTMMIVAFIISALFGFSVVNLSTDVLQNKEAYKKGEYKVEKKSILRKIFINEDKVKKLLVKKGRIIE